jgi:hypothetical protein
MKKFAYLCLAMISTVFAGSEDLDESLTLVSKVDVDSCGAYFCLSNGSLWRVYEFMPRWRSIKEWWNDVSLVPQECQAKAKDWFLGSEIAVVSKKEGLSINIDDAENHMLLSNCTHLLYNAPAGKYLFAVHLEPQDCLISLYKDAYQLGHKKGYTEGRLSVSNDAAKEFQKGYEAGYYKGFKDGKEKR